MPCTAVEAGRDGHARVHEIVHHPALVQARAVRADGADRDHAVVQHVEARGLGVEDDGGQIVELQPQVQRFGGRRHLVQLQVELDARPVHFQFDGREDEDGALVVGQQRDASLQRGPVQALEQRLEHAAGLARLAHRRQHRLATERREQRRAHPRPLGAQQLARRAVEQADLPLLGDDDHAAGQRTQHRQQAAVRRVALARDLVLVERQRPEHRLHLGRRVPAESLRHGRVLVGHQVEHRGAGPLDAASQPVGRPPAAPVEDERGAEGAPAHQQRQRRQGPAPDHVRQQHHRARPGADPGPDQGALDEAVGGFAHGGWGSWIPGGRDQVRAVGAS